MNLIEFLKVIFIGIVEGITEWLPISSTGHMILVDEFLKLDMSEAFKEMFIVVIQLGAIMAVVVLFWNKLFPFSVENKRISVKKDIFQMWFKILVACIPAGVVGILWDDELEQLFYNYQTVSIMLILFGILFIIVENYNKGKHPKITSIAEITYQTAFLIGIFQLVAAVFPGTSRSGATIVGALLLGVSRKVSAEFTFFLAVPAMAGASLIKLVKFGLDYTGAEIVMLITGMLVAFFVSVYAIKFLMGYIKRHDFKVFGWYRIILGCAVLGYFLLA
jgi:undecaprenyl-diphosphatase